MLAVRDFTARHTNKRLEGGQAWGVVRPSKSSQIWNSHQKFRRAPSVKRRAPCASVKRPKLGELIFKSSRNGLFCVSRFGNSTVAFVVKRCVPWKVSSALSSDLFLGSRLLTTWSSAPLTMSVPRLRLHVYDPELVKPCASRLVNCICSAWYVELLSSLLQFHEAETIRGLN